MPEELTNAERIALARVDEAVLAEAKAVREHERELARIESGRIVDVERLRMQAGDDRRQRIGWALAGLAIVTVILVIVAAIWVAVDRDRQKQVRLEQVRQQTAQECIKAGNIWYGDSCLIAQRPAPAPR